MMSGDLAAAYMYEPWISKVIEAVLAHKSVINTDPDMLKRHLHGCYVYEHEFHASGDQLL